MIGNLRAVSRAPRAFVVGMRNREGQVQKERCVTTVIEPLHGLAHDQIVGIVVVASCPATGEADINAPNEPGVVT